jgi:hypothetical protein
MVSLRETNTIFHAEARSTQRNTKSNTENTKAKEVTPSEKGVTSFALYLFNRLAGWTGLTGLSASLCLSLSTVRNYLPGMSRGISLFSMSLRLAISQEVKNTNLALFAINS